MSKKIVLICLTILCMGLVSCNKIDNSVQKENETQEKSNLDEAIDNVSDDLKGIDISKDDIEKKESNEFNKITSEKYQGEVSYKDSPHSNKVEIGIVTNKDTGEKYSFTDLFNITDEFVHLVIDTSNNQLDDMSKIFTSNFEKSDWEMRLNDVAKDDALSYFIFNDNEELEIYFDVPPAFGTYMKVVTLEKSQWINFVKDKSLF